MSKEGSKEYYLSNRDKIKLNDIETWKYYPIGEPMREPYDYLHQSLSEYLERYYSKYEKSSNYVYWKRWMITTILPLYNNDFNGWKRISDYDKKNFEMPVRFKNWNLAMIKFYTEIKASKIFDDDILLFIAYMFAFDFFNNMSFKEWIKTKNFDIGFRKQEEDKYSFTEISKQKYGMNLIRDKLMKLDWHKR